MSFLKKLIPLIFIFGLALTVGCGGPSKKDLVGTFSRVTPTVTETLEIRADGTFTQTVEARGKTWTIIDTWNLQPRGVTFNRFYHTYDIEKQIDLIPPTKMALKNCFWNDGYLVWGDDDVLYVKNGR